MKNGGSLQVKKPKEILQRYASLVKSLVTLLFHGIPTIARFVKKVLTGLYILFKSNMNPILDCLSGQRCIKYLRYYVEDVQICVQMCTSKAE